MIYFQFEYIAIFGMLITILSLLYILFKNKHLYDEQIKINKELKKQNTRLNDPANQLNEAKQSFLANITHELRTPMNGILGFTSVLLDIETEEDKKKYINIIHNSGEILLTIINDILDSTKIELGNIEFHFMDFDLIHTLNDVVHILSKKSHSKNSKIHISIPDNLPRIVKNDPGRFRQVLMNLISNAQKFSKDEDIDIKVSKLKEDEKNIQLKIAVSDGGIGIDEKDQDKIFESFTQSDDSLTREYSGIGLGLSITKSIIELMNGEIGVKNNSGKGCTFWFTVTFKKSTNLNQLTFLDKDIHKELKGKHLLYVCSENIEETFTFDESLIKDFLQSFEVDITEIIYSRQFLNKVSSQKQPFKHLDCILVEYKLENMTGFEFGKEIKRIPYFSNVPMLMLSSISTVRGDAATAKMHGFSGFLSCYSDQELLQGIIEVMHQNQQLPNDAHFITKYTLQTEAKKHRILVIEENSANSTLLKVMIHQIGYQCEVVNDINLGIQYILNKFYDVVFLNIEMPFKDGIQAVQEIRTSNSTFNQVPIVGISVEDHEDIQEHSSKMGFNDFLIKPISKLQLLETIKKLIPQTS